MSHCDFDLPPSHKITCQETEDYGAPRDTLYWGFSFLPPRFFPLIDPGALPCPSTLLLPTQPPITVSTCQERQKNSIQTESNSTYKSFYMQMQFRVKVLKKGCPAGEKKHHRRAMTAQHFSSRRGQPRAALMFVSRVAPADGSMLLTHSILWYYLTIYRYQHKNCVSFGYVWSIWSFTHGCA